MTKFLICDLREEWIKKPYITFWCPNNAGYAWPLSWAGDYTVEQINARPNNYTDYSLTKRLMRFAVPREWAESLAINPKPGWIDGDAGPVILNTGAFRTKLRKKAYIPKGVYR